MDGSTCVCGVVHVRPDHQSTPATDLQIPVRQRSLGEVSQHARCRRPPPWSIPAKLDCTALPSSTQPDLSPGPCAGCPTPSQGNLCWEAALEVTMAAKSVHAMVMDPAGKTMDPE